MQVDKLYHFLVGLLIAAILWGIYTSLWLSLLIVSVVGIAKEVYDCKKPNPTGFDFVDLLATIAGGAVITVIRAYHG